MYGRRRNVGANIIGSGMSRSGTQLNEPGSLPSALSNHQSSRRNYSSPPMASGALRKPPKRLRRTATQATAYTEPVTEPEGQGHMEIDHSSDDSGQEYQNSRGSDETESDTEPDPEDIDVEDATASRQILGSQVANRRRSNCATTVRISTGSGSQLAGPARRTPAPRGRIVRSRVYSPPTFPSSSAPRFSSPLGNLSATTSGIRSSSPAGHMSTPRQENWLGSNSRRNMVTGAERAIVEFAKSLILRYTLFEDPLPNVVALTAQVHRVWDAAVARIADSEYIAPTEECVNLVSGLLWA